MICFLGGTPFPGQLYLPHTWDTLNDASLSNAELCLKEIWRYAFLKICLGILDIWKPHSEAVVLTWLPSTSQIEPFLKEEALQGQLLDSVG